MTPDIAIFRPGNGQAPPSGPFVALIPGEMAVVHTVDLPARVSGAARAGIARRQVVDHLSLSPGAVELHLVRGSGWSHVVVIDGTKMAALREGVAPMAERCRALMPDYFALPAAPDTWVLHLQSAGDAPRVVARLADTFGFSAEWPVAQELLRLSDPKPAAIDVYGPLPDAMRAQLEALGGELRHKGAAPPLAPPVKGAYPVDLREDRAATLRRIETGLRRWVATAALVLVAALSWTVAEWLRLDRAETALRSTNAAVERLLRDTFIPSGPILDARAQVTRITAAAPGDGDTPPDGADALALLQQAAVVMLNAGVVVQSLSHGAGEGLSVTLDVASFAALDGLVADLRADGLRVSVPQSSVTDAGKTRAILRIEQT